MKKLTHLALSLVVISTVVIFDPLGLVCGSDFTAYAAISSALALAAEKAEPLDLNTATAD